MNGPVNDNDHRQLGQKLKALKTPRGAPVIVDGRPNWNGNFAPPTGQGEAVRAPMAPPTVAQVDLYVSLGGLWNPNLYYRGEISAEISKLIEGGATTLQRQEMAERRAARLESARRSSQRRRDRQREWKKHYLPKGW